MEWKTMFFMGWKSATNGAIYVCIYTYNGDVILIENAIDDYITILLGYVTIYHVMELYIYTQIQRWCNGIWPYHMICQKWGIPLWCFEGKPYWCCDSWYYWCWVLWWYDRNVDHDKNDKIVDKLWCEVSRHPCAHVHAYVSSSLASLTLSLESRDCPMKASFTRK